MLRTGLVLSCLVLSCLVLSCLVLSYLVLSIDDRWLVWCRFIPNKFGPRDLTYEQFVSQYVDEKVIRSEFDEAVEKMEKIDKLSDIKMFDWFMDNYKTTQLFSNSWYLSIHPSFYHSLFLCASGV